MRAANYNPALPECNVRNTVRLGWTFLLLSHCCPRKSYGIAGWLRHQADGLSVPGRARVLAAAGCS